MLNYSNVGESKVLVEVQPKWVPEDQHVGWSDYNKDIDSITALGIVGKSTNGLFSVSFESNPIMG